MERLPSLDMGAARPQTLTLSPKYPNFGPTTEKHLQKSTLCPPILPPPQILDSALHTSVWRGMYAKHGPEVPAPFPPLSDAL